MPILPVFLSKLSLTFLSCQSLITFKHSLTQWSKIKPTLYSLLNHLNHLDRYNRDITTYSRFDQSIIEGKEKTRTRFHHSLKEHERATPTNSNKLYLVRCRRRRRRKKGKENEGPLSPNPQFWLVESVYCDISVEGKAGTRERRKRHSKPFKAIVNIAPVRCWALPVHL